MKDSTYVVRLLGEMEQYEISQGIYDELNKHDNKIVKYVNDSKKLLEKIQKEVEDMQKIARKGKAVEMKKSSVAIPQADITLNEAIELFEGEGLMPG